VIASLNMGTSYRRAGAVLLSGLAGMAGGGFAYALWLFPSHSWVLALVSALGGAAVFILAARLASFVIGRASGRPSSQFQLSGALITLVLLLPWMAVPLNLWMGAAKVTFYNKAIAIGLCAFVFLIVFGCLLARKNYKLAGGAAFLALALPVLAAAMLLRMKNPGTRIRSLPLAAQREHGPPRVRVTTGKITRTAAAIAPGVPLRVSLTTPPRSVLKFELGPAGKARQTLKVRTTIIQGRGGRALLGETVLEAGSKEWKEFRSSLDPWAGQAVVLEVSVTGAESEPVYLSGLSIFESRDQPRVNVVILLFDALRADALGCYGFADSSSTPEMDRLAQRGVLFKNAISPSCWTMPAVNSIMTSKMPTQHGSFFRLDWRHTTLAQLLARNGVETGAVVSNFIIGPDSNHDKGFIEFHKMSVLEMGWRNAEAAIKESLEWIKDSDRPFFLYVHVFDPHDPYLAPPPHETFPSAGGALSLLGHMLRFPFLVPHFYGKGKNQHGMEISADEIADMKSRYLGEVGYVDAQAGVFVDALHDMGLWDDTLVIITSDHGESFREHGMIRHANSLYREEIHVPLIIAGGPVEGPGRTVATPVSTIDIMPTVADFLGIEVPPGLEGRSLTPAFTGAPLAERPVFSEFAIMGLPELSMSVVKGDYHFIKRVSLETGEVLRTGLFDWRSDPAEERNLAGAKPRKAVAMQGVMEEYFSGLAGRKIPDPRQGEALEQLGRKLRAMGYIK